MGLHCGIVAVKADIEALIAAFPLTWPHLELETIAALPGFDASQAWLRARRAEVASAEPALDDPGTKLYSFWQDGPWAVVMDTDHGLAFDDRGLGKMSERFGLALSFDGETLAEIMKFALFERGKQVRSIVSTGGRAILEGRKLWREAGIPVRRLDESGIARLQRRFGITPLHRLADDLPCKGVAFLDHTDYAPIRSRLRQVRAAADASTRA